MFNTQCNLDMTEASQVSSENEKKRKEKTRKVLYTHYLSVRMSCMRALK